MGSKQFWNKEYKDKGGNERQSHLAISDTPSEDLLHFLQWLEREYRGSIFNKESLVFDAGCGNGRNLIYLANTYHVHGVGYDISQEALEQARAKSHPYTITYTARSIAGPIALESASVDLVLDMMASHFLTEQEREELLAEIHRILKPGGWLFYKTFLLDGDMNARELLRDHPGTEHNTYIHPKIGVPEHVSTEEEIAQTFAPYFTIHKILRSHKHIDKHGRANKRRSISVYAERI